jgi:hypothetical protein
MADTRRNLHQLLKGKQLYSSTLYGVYTEVLHDLTAAAKGETGKTTITAHLSIKEFHEQRRQKQKPTYNTDKRAKNDICPSRNFMNKEDERRNLHTTLTKEPRSLQHPPQESMTPNCSQSLKFPAWNFFTPWRSAWTPPSISDIKHHPARHVDCLSLY